MEKGEEVIFAWHFGTLATSSGVMLATDKRVFVLQNAPMIRAPLAAGVTVALLERLTALWLGFVVGFIVYYRIDQAGKVSRGLMKAVSQVRAGKPIGTDLLAMLESEKRVIALTHEEVSHAQFVSRSLGGYVMSVPRPGGRYRWVVSKRLRSMLEPLGRGDVAAAREMYVSWHR